MSIVTQPKKLHAMLRDFGDRENTRVRDLVDLVCWSSISS